MRKKIRVHPGKFIKESLPEYGITQYGLAKGLNIPHSRLTAIIQGRRAITVDTALRLSAYFGNSAEFWLNLQNSYDLEAINSARIRAQVTPHPVQPPATPPVAGEPPPFTPETIREAMKGIKAAAKVRAASKRPRRPAKAA